MTSLAPALDAALAAERALVTLLIEVDLPGYDLRLMFGRGRLPWGAKTFLAEDARFGTLAAIDAIEDGSDDEDGDGDTAPSLGFSMFPNSAATAAQLCSATFQGSPVAVWLAGINRATGLIIADPDLLFSGFLDQPTLKVGKGKREVDFACVSEFDLLLEDDEGARLSDAFLKSIWPGETGFANVTGLVEQKYWGLATPRTGAVVAGGVRAFDANANVRLV